MRLLVTRRSVFSWSCSPAARATVAEAAMDRPMPRDMVANKIVPVKPRAVWMALFSNWLKKNRSMKSTEKMAMRPMEEATVMLMMWDMVEPVKKRAVPGF